MKVILNVNKPSSLNWDVQSCSSVEGFLEVEKLYPEDEYVIDEGSYEAFLDYMERQAMSKVEDFCEEMGINTHDFSAMLDWYSVKDHLMAPIYEEEDAENDWYCQCCADAMFCYI